MINFKTRPYPLFCGAKIAYNFSYSGKESNTKNARAVLKKWYAKQGTNVLLFADTSYGMGEEFIRCLGKSFTIKEVMSDYDVFDLRVKVKKFADFDNSVTGNPVCMWAVFFEEI